MMHCESVEDEFELFRAQSYGVESVLRHQRAASVRASAKVKVISSQGDPEKPSPEITPQPRSAAERKASFKSSARRRIYQQRIPEEEITAGDNQTTSGGCDQDGDGGQGVVRPLPGTSAGRSGAVDDIGLTHHRADDSDVNDDVTVTSQDICRVYRMRSFYTKSGNIVNRGDSMRLRAPTSGKARHTHDVVKALPSTGSSTHVVHDRASPKLCAEQSNENNAPDATACRETSRDHLTVGHAFASGPTRCQRLSSSNESTEDIVASAYRVLVLGSNGVGKTKLIEQLMTSEYLANKESFAGTKFRIIIITTRRAISK